MLTVVITVGVFVLFLGTLFAVETFMTGKPLIKHEIRGTGELIRSIVGGETVYLWRQDARMFVGDEEEIKFAICAHMGESWPKEWKLVKIRRVDD